MQFLGSVFSLCLFAYVHGSCSYLAGNWRNNLGSNMTIVVYPNTSRITGYYNTSVESTRGAASMSSRISGMVKATDEGSLIAFNVLWNHGASLTAWVGQCLVCDGKETIYTTWALRSLQPSKKRWMSTRINEDTFWRVDDLPGTDGEANNEMLAEAGSDLLGRWVSVSGDSVEINGVTRSGVESGGNVEGLHTTPEAANGAPVFGRFDGNETYTALGFAAAGESSIKGWAGHIYNPQDPTKTIETSWLSYAFSNNCNNPRKYVNYGMDNYSKAQ